MMQNRKHAFDADTFRFCFLLGTILALSVFVDTRIADKVIPASQTAALMGAFYAIAIGSWLVVGLGVLLVRAVLSFLGR